MARVQHVYYFDARYGMDMLRYGFDYWTGRSLVRYDYLFSNAVTMYDALGDTALISDLRRLLSIPDDAFMLVDSGGFRYVSGTVNISPEAIYTVQSNIKGYAVVLDHPCRDPFRATREEVVLNARKTAENVRRVLKHIDEYGLRSKLYLVIQSYDPYTSFNSFSTWSEIAVEPFVGHEAFEGIALSARLVYECFVHGLRQLRKKDYYGFKKVHLFGLWRTRPLGLYLIRDMLDIDLLTFDSASLFKILMSNTVMVEDGKIKATILTESPRYMKKGLFTPHECGCMLCERLGKDIHERYVRERRNQNEYRCYLIIHSLYMYSRLLERVERDPSLAYRYSDNPQLWYLAVDDSLAERHGIMHKASSLDGSMFRRQVQARLDQLGISSQGYRRQVQRRLI
ncbi:MAG: hypothetical protein QXY39_03430 [Thermofilaceae archaeon]